MLKFDSEDVQGEMILEIFGEEPKTLEDGTFDCWSISMRTAKGFVDISVNQDTDELILQLLKQPNSSKKLIDIDSQLKFVGKRFGWCWTAQNYLGYSDMFVLGFTTETPGAALDPAWIFVGCASSLQFYEVSEFSHTLGIKQQMNSGT